MTKSEFGYFCAGVAAGALGHKFYPQLKEKLAPYMAGAMVFAHEAFGDAMKDAMEAVAAMQQSGESAADIVSARPGTAGDSPAAGAESAAA